MTCEASLQMFSAALNDYMSQSDTRSSYWVQERTGVSKTMVGKARQGKALLKNDDAFLIMDMIKGDSFLALSSLREIPFYKNFASRQITMIEIKGCEIAKRGDKKLYFYSQAKYTDLLAFVTVSRSLEEIKKRKGEDTIQLVNSLLQLEVLTKLEDDKITTAKLHVVDKKSLPNVLSAQLTFFNKFPALLKDIHFSMKSVTPDKKEAIAGIIDKTIKDIAKITSDPSGEVGISWGIYFGLTDDN